MAAGRFTHTADVHLTEAGIRVFIVRGNDDAESVITKHLSLPKGVHLFSGRGRGNGVDRGQAAAVRGGGLAGIMPSR